MKKPLEEEDTLLQAGIIETSDVESKDTLYRLMSTITCSIAMAICLFTTSEVFLDKGMLFSNIKGGSQRF
jgi:hypothetical protein